MNKINWLLLVGLVGSVACTNKGSFLDGGPIVNCAHDAGPIEDAGLMEQPAITSWLEGQVDSAPMVGMVGVIVEGSEIVYLKAFGFADREAEVPADGHKTVWRLASLSKGVTGVIATRLAQRGEIDLNEELPNLEPEFAKPTHYFPSACQRGLDGGRPDAACAVPIPEDSPSLTLYHLLHNYGGIPHYPNSTRNPKPDVGESDDPDKNTGLRWGLKPLSGMPLVSRPGRSYNYSTFGFNLAGAAMEALTGRSFDELLRDEVSTPADAPSLQVERGWEPIACAAKAYKPARADTGSTTPRVDGWNDISWKAPGGGLAVTAVDYAHYCSALLASGLTGEDRDSVLWSPTAPGRTYAKGFHRQRNDAGVLRVFHSGSQQGARTGIQIHPEENRCFIALTNTTTVSGTDLVRGMAARWE